MAERKQFDPTRKRLDEARKEGNVLKSQLLTQSLALGAGFLVFSLTIRLPWVRSQLLLNYTAVDPDLAGVAWHYLGLTLLGVSAVLIPAVVATILLEGKFVGFRFDASILALQPSRLNPVSGFSKVVRGLKQSWLMLLKFSVLFAFALWVSYSTFPKLVVSIMSGPESRLAVFGACWLTVIGGGIALLLLLGGVELVVKRREFLNDLSMSSSELRQEHREQEGDPHIRAARRRQHRALSTEEIVKRLRSSRVLVVEREANSSSQKE